MSQPVTIVRDRWGIPHITAQNEHDLFFAQGFAQAQDRLFQMDLWRRAAQGRLAEVLGPNFIDRDVMTLRVQYHGDADLEWESYASGTKAIAEAFVAGINAWVFRVRPQLPDEFVLAGWIPDLWTPEDLLNRTDAFLASEGADLDAFRAQLIAEVGERAANALMPALRGQTPWPVTDLAAAGRVVSDALHRAGAAPFFAGFAAPFAGSNAWAIPRSRSASGGPILANDPHRPLTTPSPRYLVHLKAPGWNVIGATSPWRPGVAIGHNDRVAWGMAAHPQPTEDIRVERLNPANRHDVDEQGHYVHNSVVKDAIYVKKSSPFSFEREYTTHGVVIASDREHHLVFTLGWTGFDAGAAPELGALALDRARSIGELRSAIKAWKMPVVDVVYADNATVGHQISGAYGRTESSPSPESIPIAANGNAARTKRLEALLSGRSKYTLDDVKRQQQDVVSWNASQLIPRLEAVRPESARIENARRQLLAWDRRVTPDSPAGALYVLWEQTLWRKIAATQVPAGLLDAYLAHVPIDISQALSAPNTMVLAALASAVDRAAAEPEPAASSVMFRHPLAITQAARQRFNVGPFRPGGYRDTVQSFSRGSNGDAGPSFREILDVADWDRSVATNAPGQSERTQSAHFSDLAKLWAAGEYFPLVFSSRAIEQNAESTLVLKPR